MSLLCFGSVFGDSRIAFSSAQTAGTSDRDIWKSNDDGTFQEQVTSESADVFNPTIAHAGRLVLYDNGSNLFVHNFNGTGSATDLGPGRDPLAGPYINSDRDFRVLYTIASGGHLVIQMATFDVSANTLIDAINMTPNLTLDQMHPAFCGLNHFVWASDDSYEGQICYQEFDANGPVSDTKECYFSGYGDPRADIHPACDSNGRTVAWARENADSQYSGNHEIWTMDLDDDDPESTATRILSTINDATMPVWSPGDGQIAFAWNRLWMGSSDYEIWKINSNGTGGQLPVTDNLDDDDAPSWGPAVLP